MQRLLFAALAFHTARDRWPALAELQAGDRSLPQFDPWHNGFVARLFGNEFEVDSAGPDGAFDTPDDIRSTRLPPAAADPPACPGPQVQEHAAKK